MVPVVGRNALDLALPDLVEHHIVISDVVANALIPLSPSLEPPLVVKRVAVSIFVAVYATSRDCDP